MELTVLERMVLQGLLPKESDYTTLKLVRIAREELSFDDIENRKLEFRQDGDQIRWNEDVDVRNKEIEFGEVVTLMIVAELKKLEGEKKLRDEHFTIYEKFVEAKNTVDNEA